MRVCVCVCMHACMRVKYFDKVYCNYKHKCDKSRAPVSVLPPFGHYDELHSCKNGKEVKRSSFGVWRTNRPKQITKSWIFLPNNIKTY